MRILQEINRIKRIMLINEVNINITEISVSNIFKNFDLSNFKNQPPPSDNSDETKKEIEFLKGIDLKKRFVQEKDDIPQNFIDFLKTKDINENEIIYKLLTNVRFIIVELKNHYKRPRPFRVDQKLNNPMLKSTEGFAYPSGHSTQSNLVYLVLSHKYPKLKNELKKIKDDIVYSRQMAKAHYPSDIKFGEKLAKSLFDYLKTNNLIN